MTEQTEQAELLETNDNQILRYDLITLLIKELNDDSILNTAEIIGYADDLFNYIQYGKVAYSGNRSELKSNTEVEETSELESSCDEQTGNEQTLTDIFAALRAEINKSTTNELSGNAPDAPDEFERDGVHYEEIKMELND